MDHLASSDLTPLDALLEREQIRVLLECLEKLRQRYPQRHRAILRRFYHQESYAQILSQIKASSEAAVRQWVSRSLQDLRDCLNRKQALE